MCDQLFMVINLWNCYHLLLTVQVTTSLGRWILEDTHVYNPFSGVTNNQSESFNATLTVMSILASYMQPIIINY